MSHAHRADLGRRLSFDLANTKHLGWLAVGMPTDISDWIPSATEEFYRL